MASNRLFFALWPIAKIKKAIEQNTSQLRKSITGKYVAPGNWHITLAFLGDVDNNTKKYLIDQANDIHCFPFTLEFDKLLYFKKTKILSIGINGSPELSELNFLVQECQRIQNSCGLKTETRKYLPHITLARKVAAPELKLNIKTISWLAHEFVLVSSSLSEKGSDYTVLNRWSLLLK